mgnify:FL=1
MAEVFFRPRALRALEKSLSKKEREKLNELIDQLVRGLFPPATKKLSGMDNAYRLRIGRWRVLFMFFVLEKRIEIVDIFMEKGARDYKRRQKLF